MGNLLRKPIAVLGTTVALSFAWTGTALAWDAGGEFDIFGGRGGAMWDWDSPYKIVNLRTVAWDRSCNAEGIYAYAIVHDQDEDENIGHVYDNCEGGHNELNGMYYDNLRGPIIGVTAQVCRDVDGPDECNGQYYENPLKP